MFIALQVTKKRIEKKIKKGIIIVIIESLKCIKRR